MPVRIPYPELQRFPEVRSWAEAGGFSPPTTLFAFYAAISASLLQQFRGLAADMAEAADQIPKDMRRRCYRDQSWVLRHYLGGLSALGLEGIAGVHAVTITSLGLVPLAKMVRVLRDGRRGDGLPFAWVPLRNGERQDAEQALLESTGEIEAVAKGFRERLLGSVSGSPPTDLMVAASRYILGCQAVIFEFAVSPPEQVQLTGSITTEYLASMDYMVGVMLPALLGNCDHPTVLYRRARHGSVDALRQLVAIDPSVLTLPGLEAVLVKARRSRHRVWLREALDHSPVDDAAPRDTKLRCVGSIVKCAEYLGDAMTRPDMQRLFDAVARDLSGGQVRLDPDIGALSDDGLRKAVGRALASRD